ncbi:ABC transporter ATP-binding protein [Nocardioides sp. AE5]|uniref:ABC transporter ATP-binding protein n=1 Tax=Nocardioides sp. AE5 TaxID=2962573 RepID=UPI002881A1D2|nr:ABC transporter ATP-binding protein [Nocardioides sp. AE5]MDT0203928.1 ABC transporter ATP-binding protein [Nocardioides sp. AE5]
MTLSDPVSKTGIETVLSVEGLRLDLLGSPGQPGLVDDVSFEVRAGETVALIGESGCGKSITALAILGLLPAVVAVSAGTVLIAGEKTTGAKARRLAALRGSSVGTVFQDPMSSLNPTMTIGAQIAESRQLHLKESRKVATEKAIELLELVGIPNPRSRAAAYPFELSGGMQQRALIAAAVACEPQLLIADEPTTALDVTVQAEILELLKSIQERNGMGVLLVTHDLGVVAGVADRVVVMYAGETVEQAQTEDLFASPAHPYTRALLSSVPQTGKRLKPLPIVPGRVPPAGAFPQGCRFQDRCSYMVPSLCLDGTIPVAQVHPHHESRCLRIDEVVRSERTP